MKLSYKCCIFHKGSRPTPDALQRILDIAQYLKKIGAKCTFWDRYSLLDILGNITGHRVYYYRGKNLVKKKSIIFSVH